MRELVMEARPYAVVIERGMTRFVLPRRARTRLQRVGGYLLMAVGVGVIMLLIFLGRQMAAGGVVLPEGFALKLMALFVLFVCTAPFIIGWKFLRGDQGEIRASVDGDLLTFHFDLKG